MKNKNKVLYIIIVALILAGISVMCTVGFNITKDNDVPSFDVMDEIKPYVLPMTIITLIIAMYLGIRYRKQNFIKVTGLSLGYIIAIQALYLGLVAILRIPFNEYILPIGIFVYVIFALGIMNIFNKEEERNEK